MSEIDVFSEGSVDIMEVFVELPLMMQGIEEYVSDGTAAPEM